MSDTYTGKADDRVYSGDAADIRYSTKRCIHAAECVRNLAAVFDTNKRPWINPNGAPVDDIVEVVNRCPSGALHVERKDGGIEEAIPQKNVITVWRDGPLQFHGDLSIAAAHVAVDQETRATLCRCGESKNKPFCDNSHKDAGFQATENAPTEQLEPQTQAGKLTIKANPNGSLEVNGAFEMRSDEGAVLMSGERTWLCRCGHSSRKPFCDGTHKRVGFQAE